MDLIDIRYLEPGDTVVWRTQTIEVHRARPAQFGQPARVTIITGYNEYGGAKRRNVAPSEVEPTFSIEERIAEVGLRPNCPECYGRGQARSGGRCRQCGGNGWVQA